ncbi:unnamed protein product, partial [Ectocarpus sp. 6 AP-2014]
MSLAAGSAPRYSSSLTRPILPTNMDARRWRGDSSWLSLALASAPNSRRISAT